MASFNLSDFGIDLAQVQEDPEGAIKHVLDLYKESAKQYRESGEKQTTGVKKVAEKIKSDDPATVNLTDSLMTQLRKLTYEVLLNDPAVSVLLFDQLQDLKDGIASFRQEAMRGITIEDDETDIESSEDQEMKFEEVEFLHKALGNFVNFAMMNGLSVHDLPGDLTTVGRKSGKKEVSLPRKPNGPSDSTETDSTKGRHAAIYKMHYAINGEMVPTGISLNRLALFYCSTPETWLNGSELMELVKKETGAEWGAGDWDVNVPIGRLSARKIQQG